MSSALLSELFLQPETQILTVNMAHHGQSYLFVGMKNNSVKLACMNGYMMGSEVQTCLLTCWSAEHGCQSPWEVETEDMESGVQGCWEGKTEDMGFQNPMPLLINTV